MKHTYCVRCKKFTANKGKITHGRTSNGRRYLKVKCKICGNTKSTFV